MAQDTRLIRENSGRPFKLLQRIVMKRLTFYCVTKTFGFETYKITKGFT